MYKVTAIFFSIFLIAISLAGSRMPNGELGMFLTINEPQTIGRLVLAFLLLTSLSTNHFPMKWLLGGGAAGLFSITVAGLFGSGAASFYLLPIDLFVALEGIVLCLLGSVRLSGNRVPTFKRVWQTSGASPRLLRHSTASKVTQPSPTAF